MTDDQRAERAFRDAFDQRADTLEPAPLSPRTGRRRWPLLVAGAAALAVVAVTATFAIVNAGDDPGGPDPAAATSSATETPTTSGTRTVTYRGVAVDVPEAWAEVPVPHPGGCGYPGTPFVAIEKPFMVYTRMLCASGDDGRPEGFPVVDRSEWMSNVEITSQSSAGESLPDGETTYRGWTLTRATAGGVRVEVLTDASTPQIAAQVVGSVRSVDVDANGCDSSSPVQAAEFVRPPAFDVTQVDTVTAIAVCLYVRGDTTTPGLVASSLLEDDDAQAELEAIQAAPAGGGPDQPESCLPDSYGDVALVVRLTTDDGPHNLYAYYDSCFGNGIDDGTTLRALTADDCRPLFSTDVMIMGGQKAVIDRCHPHGS